MEDLTTANVRAGSTVIDAENLYDLTILRLDYKAQTPAKHLDRTGLRAAV